MLQTIESDKLEQIKSQNPETRSMIDELLNRQKQIISLIAHEIRNPLSLAYSSLQLIEHSHPEVRSFAHWSETLEDVEFIELLLKDLTSLNQSYTLHIQKVDLQALLKRMAISFAASLEEDHIQFTSRIEETIPCIQGDPIKLQEVFLNLLRNAKDAVSNSELSKPAIYLKAAYHADKNLVQIQIKDFGCGIPAEHMEDIFIPFCSHKSGGTGLGLPIAKHIIEHHGGSLSVSSNSKMGTVFTITLPSSAIE